MEGEHIIDRIVIVGGINGSRWNSQIMYLENGPRQHQYNHGPIL